VRIVAALLLGSLASSAGAATHRVGALTVELDEGGAFQGGLIDVGIKSRRPIRGVVYAVLDGRRCPAYWSGGRLRALVPIPVTFPAGPATLGIEIRTARGRARYPLPLTIAARQRAPEEGVLAPDRLERAASPDAVRDGRRLQLLLRTVSRRQEWRAPFTPPVAGPPAETFGVPRTYAGAPHLESVADAIHGEYHRGLDYEVPAGTAVAAPAAATVLFAGDLAVTGKTVVLDHGFGLLTVLAHLETVTVREGEAVAAGRVVGASGETGVAPGPHLHWAVYLHGVPVDPRVTERL
jgi:murein DD-endopeptidase MepM/ murein hydrolase activator NlpD